ncbi:MAG: roadblock/LC7 domain-containing protein [Myxococcota bacterium]
MSSQPIATPTAIPELERLWQAAPGLKGVMLCTVRGEVLSLVGDMADAMSKMASFAIGLFELGARAGQESGCGDARSLLLDCAHGALFLIDVDADRLLFALAQDGVPQGSLLHDLTWCARTLRAKEAA